MQLDRDQFRAWLESNDPADCVGFSHAVCDCPLSSFLFSTTGEVVEVSPRYLNHHGHETVTPLWARDFISKVDDRPELTPVTAAQALAILAEVEAANVPA